MTGCQLPKIHGKALSRAEALLLTAALVLTMMLGVSSSFLQAQTGDPGPGLAYVRINQVGYTPQDDKNAILMSTDAETGANYTVVSVSTGQTLIQAAVPPAGTEWSPIFPYTYRLEFSRVLAPGRYFIQVEGPVPASSPVFEIAPGAALYAPLLQNALSFYHAQHDALQVDPTVPGRGSSHQADSQAIVYATPAFVKDIPVGPLEPISGPIDVSGGWLDAGDYVKLVETASYTDALLLFAAREYPERFGGPSGPLASEARFGLDWLQKMWDPDRRTLCYQVGIGDGNGTSLLGDHDTWRLPDADDQLNVHPGDPAYFQKYRPVFQVGPPGAPISPNLAGRVAADLAMGAQLFRPTRPAYAAQCLRGAEVLFDLADTDPAGPLTTTAPHDYYPEIEWRDDMELGAVEIYRALAGEDTGNLPHSAPHYYLRLAAHWAHEYIHGPNDAKDSLNLYDVSGLAHYELYRAIEDAGSPDDLEVSTDDLLADLNRQLASGARVASADPFGLGVPYGGPDATPHALGYAVEAALYDELTGDEDYRSFACRERNWALGENAWGCSFVVGAGSSFPRHLHSPIANLNIGQQEAPPILRGAVVDGPADIKSFAALSTENGMVVSNSGRDDYALFSGRGARFLDHVTAWPCVEPAIDYTALTLVLFAQQCDD